MDADLRRGVQQTYRGVEGADRRKSGRECRQQGKANARACVAPDAPPFLCAGPLTPTSTHTHALPLSLSLSASVYVNYV